MPLTLNDYFTALRLYCEENHSQRVGQAMVNVMSNMGIGMPTVGTDWDCFYRDDLIPAFLEKLSFHMENLEDQ